MAQVAAFGDAQGVVDDGLEAQHVLVEIARLVEVERGQADMGKAFVAHGGFLLTRWRRTAMVRRFGRRDKGTPGGDRRSQRKRHVAGARAILSNAASQGRTHAPVF